MPWGAETLWTTALITIGAEVVRPWRAAMASKLKPWMGVPL